MSKLPQIMLIGQIIVDVTLTGVREEPKLRFGGIMHAARALWAAGCDFGLSYIAPDYLDEQIVEYATSLGAILINKIGVVTGSPNVILVGEPKEYGPQKYEYLLRDHHRVDLHMGELEKTMNDGSWTDVLIFPGGFELSSIFDILNKIKSKIYIDINSEPQDWKLFRLLKKPIECIILSTSSNLFTQHLKGEVSALKAKAKQANTHSMLFKENRGGSRFFVTLTKDKVIQTPAQIRPIAHSVGVGDCFNAIFVFMRHRCPDQSALAYASCIAAEYAGTTYPDDFKIACQGWMKISAPEIAKLRGVTLAWEDRRIDQIYIAAPDFNFVNTEPVEQLAEALRYHNFSPRLPVRENGQLESNASAERRLQLFHADIRLLNECTLLIAVLLYDDPGTLIEIGIASEKGMPVIVYDPFHRAENLMLTELPHLISSDLDEIINAVFEQVSKTRKAISK